MAVRLYSEFSSSEGNRYKIEIHDSAWGAAPASTFKVDGAGFQLTYDGETDDIISPIVSSKLTFGAYSENATFETFINTLKTFQENRFRVAVYIDSSALVVESFTERVQSDGGTVEAGGCLLDAVVALGGPDGYSLWWAGWITQDLVSVEDTSKPYILEITATDGLGKLANINYDVANDIDQGGLRLTRITQLTINALKLAGLYDFWGAGDTFLETSADWWETTAHTYSTASDPLYLTAVDAGLLQSYDSDNNLQYNNGLEALRQVATLFNARIYLQAGRWVLEQYGQRAASSRYVSRYTYSGTAINRTLVSDDVVVDQSTYSARKSGNNWDFLPAMRKAQINYVQKFLNPYGLFGGWRFQNTSPTFTGGFMAGGSGIQLGLGTAAFKFNFKGNTTAAGLMPLIRATIAIQDANGVTYYYGRAFNGTTAPLMYSTAGWSTVPGFYYFDLQAVNYVQGQSGSITQVVQIITEDLPTSGLLGITIQLDSIRVMATNAQYNFTTATIDAPMLFNIVNGGNQSNAGTIFASVNNEAGVDSQLTLDLGEVFFAEGPPQTGHLAVYNGTEWVGSNLWRKGSTGTGVRILKLLTTEALALHVRPIERYNGEFIGSQSFGRRLVFESAAYLRTGGTFTARMDEWDGELYAIQRIRTAVTELEEVDVLQLPVISGSSTTVGVSPNDFDTGRVAGMIIDSANQALGPFQEVTTGGKVLGTLDVQQKITAEQDLEVIGTTTLDSVDVVDVVVSNDLDVTGSTTLGTLAAGSSTLSSATVSGTLGVTGTSTLGTVSAGATTLASSSVTGNQTVGGTLGVTGASTLGTLNAGASTLASSSVTGNQTVGGTLGVTGASTLGTLNAGASSLSSATVSGTLGVTGTSTLGTVSAGAATLASSSVTGNQTVGGTLGVTGTSTLGTVSAGATTLASSSVTGNQTVGGTLGVTGATSLSSATVSSTLGVTGSTTLGTLSAGASTLASSSVTGNQTVGGTLGVTGASTLGTVSAGATTLASSSVTGNQTVGGTLGVTGASTLGTLSAGASTLSSATVSGTLGVTGATTLGTLESTDVATFDRAAIVGMQDFVDAFSARVTADGGTLEAATCVSDAIKALSGTSFTSLTPATIESTLEVKEETVLRKATTIEETLGVSGATTVGGTLGVTGTSTLGTLSAGASTLSSASVTGNQTVGGTLGVTGTSTLSNTNIEGAANFNTTASVNGAWYASIDDVTASASGTYEVKNTDYILFATWSGGSGTFTIALPPVESSEGRMIRVKTDSTISNSNALSIVPNEGDTGVLIDGESSSSMTRSYDGATYLCHSGEWWVIQKKDKG